MKQFFSSFFGALLAVVVFVLGTVFLGFVIIAGLAAVGEKPAQVEKGSYLVFDFTANIQDAPNAMQGLDQVVAAFGGSHAPGKLQLRQVVRAIRAAASDDDIAGLYLTGTFMPDGYGTGYAALKEVREAIEEFKASGKPVRAYFKDLMTVRDFYVASTATELAIDPYSAVTFLGLASQPVFFAGALDKLGVGVQVTRVGKYKSAVEPYTRSDMSPENRAQVQKLLGDIWSDLLGTVAKARGMKPEELQAIVDREGLMRGGRAKEMKLVDRVASYDEVQAELKQQTGVKDGDRSFRQIPLSAYVQLVGGDGLQAKRAAAGRVLSSDGGDRVAVVYAEGTIVDGDGNQDGIVWGDKFAREIRRLRQDKHVKAIVLRVNSPGGSASASEAIQRELRLAREVKPVIVSMGTVAASGGYWISAYGDRIFAEPTTITGSIGVFGMFFNVKELANEKLGITFDTVKTGEFADALTIARPKTDAELAMFQRLVDWIYDQFIAKVAESRKLAPEKVREIAQGRVWSGQEAQSLGLVDEIGSLSDAIGYAAEKAGLGGHFGVSEFPRPKPFPEVLAEAFEHRYEQAAWAKGALGGVADRVRFELRELRSFTDRRGVYARLPFEIGID